MLLKTVCIDARRVKIATHRFWCPKKVDHSSGLAALVVNYGLACGIDVETDKPVRDLSGLADMILSASEREAFLTCPTERQQAFLRLWTLKEAEAFHPTKPVFF